MVRDVGLAEDLAQDAFVAAVEQWPREGRPANPGAWFMAVAKRRAIDHLRRRQRLDERIPVELGRELEASRRPRSTPRCRPRRGGDSRRPAPPHLRRLSPDPLARSSRRAHAAHGRGPAHRRDRASVPGPRATVAQRIVRAKRSLAAATCRSRRHSGGARARLASVLEVVYLIFNEGYAATAGDDWMRPALCEDALRLGRVVASLVPDEPEAHGLVALMEIQASRTRARTVPGRPDPPARPGPLSLGPAPDPARPGGAGPVESLGAPRSGRTRSRPRSQPATRGARRPQDTDWVRIAALYDALAQIQPSPVVELNRAVAVRRRSGRRRGWSSWSSWSRSRLSAPTTSSPACAATC